jgi:hypothetical protein
MYEFAHCRLMNSFLCHCKISFNDDIMQIFHKNKNTFHFVNKTLLVNKSVFDQSSIKNCLIVVRKALPIPTITRIELQYI